MSMLCILQYYLVITICLVSAAGAMKDMPYKLVGASYDHLVQFTEANQPSPSKLVALPRPLVGNRGATFTRDSQQFGLCTTNITDLFHPPRPLRCGLLTNNKVSWPGRQPRYQSDQVWAMNIVETTNRLFFATTDRWRNSLVLSEYNIEKESTVVIKRISNQWLHGVSFSPWDNVWAALLAPSVLHNDFLIIVDAATGRVLSNVSLDQRIPGAQTLLSFITRTTTGQTLFSFPLTVGDGDDERQVIFDLCVLPSGKLVQKERFVLPKLIANGTLTSVNSGISRVNNATVLVIGVFDAPPGTAGLLLLHSETGKLLNAYNWPESTPFPYSWTYLESEQDL